MSDRLAGFLIGGVSLLVIAVVGYLVLGHRPPPGSPALRDTLPLVNACLNATSAGLLVAGFVSIRRKRRRAHHAFMLGALAVSTIFLISYVTHHWLAGSRPFTGQGWLRVVYLVILVTHVVLAAAIVPLVLTLVGRALRDDYVRHARLGRWVLPLWLYVSVTGVLVYWLLRRLASPV